MYNYTLKAPKKRRKDTLYTHTHTIWQHLYDESVFVLCLEKKSDNILKSIYCFLISLLHPEPFLSIFLYFLFRLLPCKLYFTSLLHFLSLWFYCLSSCFNHIHTHHTFRWCVCVCFFSSRRLIEIARWFIMEKFCETIFYALLLFYLTKWQ